MALLDRDKPPRVAAPPVGDAIPARLRRTGGTPRQVLAMCVIGALVLPLLSSRDLPDWADRFADAPGAQTLQTLCESWDEMMSRLGLTRPHDALRAAIARLQELGWTAGR